MKVILGLDPGIANTGYATVRGKKFIAYGVIKTRSGLKFLTRLKHIICQLDVLAERYCIEYLVIEDTLLFQRRGGRMRQAGMVNVVKVQGAIIGWALAKKIKIRIVTPTRWQSYVVGEGKRVKDKKKIIHQRLCKRFGIKVPDHVTDAMGLVYYQLRRKIK